MKPPEPILAAPVPRITLPLFPEDALPELNTNIPLTPCVPAFMLRITTAPLVVAVPSPAAILMAPPVLTVLRPAVICTAPPAPLVPLPTDSSNIPLLPEVAVPDPNAIRPLLPELLLPELNVSMPLEPAEPALRLRITTTPLLVAVPSPLPTLNAPPVFTVLRPL